MAAVTTPSAPVVRRDRPRSGTTSRLLMLATVLLAWHVIVPRFERPYMATPLGVLRAVPKVLLDDPKVWPGAVETFGVVGRGMVIAIIAGMLLGLVMGRVPLLAHAISPYVNGSYATPMIAVLPLFTLWLGFNTSATFALVMFAAVPPMAVSAYDGARSIPLRYLEVAQSFGARRRDVWFGIGIPSSLPYLLAGFRLASGRALSAVVIAEFLIGTGNGLGNHVMRLAQTFKHDQAVVAVLILTLVGLFLAVGVEAIARRVFPWFRPKS
jgi:ABC-type nitrate/sulfonate/bicarbonate transport system permease component